MKRSFPLILICGILCLASGRLDVGVFSEMSESDPLPAGWEAVPFKDVERFTVYTSVIDGGRRVIKAESEDAASGIGREMRVSAHEYPVLEWSWKAEKLVRGSDLLKKEGDDYAARVYVAFDHDKSAMGFFEAFVFRILEMLYRRPIPRRALSYIWSNNAPAGSIVSNPYTKRVKMIVVQSGPEGAGKWHAHQRNVAEDYRAAFGHEPPDIRGIGFLTDTDNTGEHVTAYYGDIYLKTAPVSGTD